MPQIPETELGFVYLPPTSFPPSIFPRGLRAVNGVSGGATFRMP
ncbi:hypothetical protein TCCBUS3UF1_8690 [Thermus sp. CCB_US3_UF1]|nr:hypothetical protein TCCBUS3UF1_8690 [Thermus sp. CCB_US3_UF1]